MPQLAHTNVYNHLAQLVAMPTVAGEEIPADESVMYCSGILQAAGMQVTTFKNEGFASLVATSRKDQKHPKVMLVGHLDVVAAALDQFELRREDGKLYGRGVLDMKFAVACFLETAITLKDRMSEYDFGIMLTTDEEVGGEHGVKFLLEQHGYGAEVVLLPDGANDWKIESQAQGGLHLQIIAKGRAAHGSRPWEADSATDKLLGFLQEARTVIPIVHEPSGATMTVSILQAGVSQNQVPDFASAMLDIRFLGSQAQGLLAKLQEIADSKDVTITTLVNIAPVELDLELPALKTWEQIVKQVRGREHAGYMTSFAASDARFFAARGIPSIVTYPEGAGHHSDHEWISEESLYQFYDCTVAFIEETAKAA